MEEPMSASILIEGKVAGQKHPIFTDWYIEWPPSTAKPGRYLSLRDLISSIVAREIEAFKSRQEERRLARVMSRQEIAKGVAQGKVDPGERELVQDVNVEEAVEVALQAFMDGLYFVFVDEVQQTDLDSEVLLKPKSKVLFLRLTALVGG
jgi:hypothetical protein